MSDQELIFGFDVGKASLGTCARKGATILDLQSYLIPAEFADTSDFRTRRRAFRTRQAHYKREDWLRRKWQEAGLLPLASEDPRLKREFPARGDNTLYTSALLRIALLQNKPLRDWQVFKALWSSIQHRGYDKDCNWERFDESDDMPPDADTKDNLDSVRGYEEALHVEANSQAAYLYPCYLEASIMGLWSWQSPTQWKLRVDGHAGKVRQKGRVAPRALVEKEIRDMFANAQTQLPKLSALNVEELLYGPAQKPYASLSKVYAQHRGTEWDAQGVLSQKVPRFDNRILNKCQLLPKRNVCKASEPLNLQVNLLMKLKNIRYTDENGEVSLYLSPQELQVVYKKCMDNLSGKKGQDITLGNLYKFIGEAVSTTVRNSNMVKGEKIKLNASGRSRFCRPALAILWHLLFEGIDPPALDITAYIQPGKPNGITSEELQGMLSRLGNTWQGFHIGDKRYIDLEAALQASGKETVILKLIGSSNNPVVRHRLTFFWNQYKKMVQDHGVPDKVILEFVRGGEGLDGAKNANEWEQNIKRNESNNDRIRGQLEEQGLKAHKWNIERFKMAEEQGWHCPYTGEKLNTSMLEYYQVDHIVPVSGDIATDAFYNRVLCTSQANQDKGNRTPYEWLQPSPERWQEFVARVTDKNSGYGKKKKELLIRSDSRELVSSYNGLAETAYIARLAQQIVGLQSGWGIQTKDDSRRIFVNDGKTTAMIRKIYGLNELLLSEEDKADLTAAKDAGQQRKVWKKNRENQKHHALDAYCISYSQDLKVQRVDEAGKVHWHVPRLEESKAKMEEKLTQIFPENTRRNTKELYPMETIYGYRKRMENGQEIHYLTARKKLFELLAKDRKKIKDIIDDDIRADLEIQSKEMTDSQSWESLLKAYKHPKRKSVVTTVMIAQSRTEAPPETDASGRLRFGEYRDFGNHDAQAGKKGITKNQFKHSKANKGQIIYQAGKNWKVQQIYVHEKVETIKENLLKSQCKLYAHGALFYAGCTIHIPKSCKAGALEIPSGVYVSRTITAQGQAKIRNSNGQDFLTSIKYLVEAGLELIQ